MTDTRDRLSRLGAARARVADHQKRRDAEKARLADLVPAHCKVCGTRIPAGEGDREAAPEFQSVGERQQHAHWLTTLPPEADAWRRRCATCSDAAHRGEAESAAISAILSKPINQVDAAAVVSALKLWRYSPSTGEPTVLELQVPLAETTGRHGRAPWSHVTPEERQRVADALARVLAERRPRRCEDGACGLCGVARALDWYESSMRWANGSPAPVCGNCRPVYIARSRPRGGDDLGRVVVEIVSGRAVPLGESAHGARAFCESRNADKAGHPEPWTYALDQISDLKLTVWTRHPQYAPADMREAAEQWHRDALAEDARKREQEHADAGTGW